MIPKSQIEPALKRVLSLLLLPALFVGCDSGPSTRAGDGTGGATEMVEKVEGDKLNAFFPKDEGEFDVVFTSEKSGFSQAKLQNDGNELATLSISDTAGRPEVRANYDSASAEVGGFPSIARGSKGTAVLAGRFQVQVRSKAESFGEADRKTWLQRFDLAGLKSLAN